MIYFNEDYIIIPNLLGIDAENCTIMLHNNVTNEQFNLDVLNDSSNGIYYKFNFDSSSLSPNEYTVTLYDDSSQCLGTFLAQKGISQANMSCFNTATEYIQFEN